MDGASSRTTWAPCILIPRLEGTVFYKSFPTLWLNINSYRDWVLPVSTAKHSEHRCKGRDHSVPCGALRNKQNWNFWELRLYRTSKLDAAHWRTGHDVCEHQADFANVLTSKRICGSSSTISTRLINDTSPCPL